MEKEKYLSDPRFAGIQPFEHKEQFGTEPTFY